MSKNDPKENQASTSTAGAVAEIAKSKAGEKLADAVKGLVQIPHNVIDYFAGPKRIADVNVARAQGRVVEAHADAEIERIRAETAEFVLDREMRKTLNRQQILAEAQKALPPPDAPVSDTPVSRDFVHSFFEEFDGISDPEVHKIAGRLLAGEVVKPGSFPRRTMRVLRDLESSDFKGFANLCRFVWNIGGPVPLVFESSGDIYEKHGVTFDSLNELATLGLISFDGLAGYSRDQLPPKFQILYARTVVNVQMPMGQKRLAIGHVLLTDAGRRLASLTNAQAIPGFVDYVLVQLRTGGGQFEVVQPKQPG